MHERLYTLHTSCDSVFSYVTSNIRSFPSVCNFLTPKSARYPNFERLSEKHTAWEGKLFHLTRLQNVCDMKEKCLCVQEVGQIYALN
jgi:hypothetical protein